MADIENWIQKQHPTTVQLSSSPGNNATNRPEEIGYFLKLRRRRSNSHHEHFQVEII